MKFKLNLGLQVIYFFKQLCTDRISIGLCVLSLHKSIILNTILSGWYFAQYTLATLFISQAL